VQHSISSHNARGIDLSCGEPIRVSAVFALRPLANEPFKEGYIKRNSQALLDELSFQRAVQTYLWAQPALNMYGMKEGSEKAFGKGYNVLPIFKKRLNSKTLITTPNSDVIYALGYLDLKEDRPMVIEVPPRLQGIIDHFWQRPIPSEGPIDGKMWSGDVGLPGPDRGLGGKYLMLPPDYKGDKSVPTDRPLSIRSTKPSAIWESSFPRASPAKSMTSFPATSTSSTSCLRVCTKRFSRPRPTTLSVRSWFRAIG